MADILPEERIDAVYRQIGFKPRRRVLNAYLEAQYDYMIERGWVSPEQYRIAVEQSYANGEADGRARQKMKRDEIIDQARADERKRIGQWLDSNGYSFWLSFAGVIDILKNGEALE